MTGERILVVDDDKLNLTLISDILKVEGYEVYPFFNGSSILEKTYLIKPSAILLDIILPDIDGFEICKMLKEDIYTKDIPIIMITGRTHSSDVKKALELGAFDYIKKPIDEVEVAARVKSVLRYNEYQEKLKAMAIKDGLTGLYNHTFLIEILEKEIKKHEKKVSSISFAMIDIDYFKKVNDAYGHLFGDKVLKGLSDMLLKSVPNSDIVGRYGGEEFGIIFTHESKGNLEKLCETLRKNVQDAEFETDGTKVKITISIGACFRENTKGLKSDEIIRKADEALYKAKSSGRNKIEIV
ncbi:diguanylate cyclase [Clostridium sp. P21]|uniref:Stage 0 sporulation protein A homolog n=1 Tax=Clostridium muellerianum TaxID=2716538 RepID=A0A7Y0HSN4_9CLOT|nr:diguanylate cyclase [Clostridium muellerianum]NMM66003.1 diguanylate cyclase [Clostridium muellerianum]